MNVERRSHSSLFLHSEHGVWLYKGFDSAVGRTDPTHVTLNECGGSPLVLCNSLETLSLSQADDVTVDCIT